MKKILLILGVLAAFAAPTYAAQSDAYCTTDDNGYCQGSSYCYSNTSANSSDGYYCGPGRRGCGGGYYCGR